MNSLKNLFEVNKEVLTKPIVIYGAGNTGMDLFVELLNRNIRVDYFCDSSSEKWGIHLMNKKVLSPDELEKIKDEYNIIIASIYFEEICTQLEGLGISNVFCYRNTWRVEV